MKPVLQALVLADHVYQDQTGKKIICGTFNTVKFSRKPPVTEVQRPDGTAQTVLMGGVQGGSPYAYLSLTDVCEGTKLLLRFVNLNQNAVLFGTEVTVSNVNRLATIEMVFPLPRLPIQEAGTYALEVVCDDGILGSCRITAENMDEKAEGPKADGPGR
jgi:hypothetical protein